MSNDTKKNATCYSCKWSFGAIEHMKHKSTLLCFPAGNRNMEQLAYKLCDYYEQKAGGDNHE